MATIRGHKLLHFLESSTPTLFPSSQDEATRNVNMEFFGLGATRPATCVLTSSLMSKGILKWMVEYESTSQIWAKLELYFTSQTRAMISQC